MSLSARYILHRLTCWSIKKKRKKALFFRINIGHSKEGSYILHTALTYAVCVCVCTHRANITRAAVQQPPACKHSAAASIALFLFF